ncbi:isochorismatase family protein (plasmid) [Rhizobium ruizarguesonis]|nr:isochorismatase family protein [Rhizobium ruizarguesonis]
MQPLYTLPKIERPALLVVDMQNDFVRAGAPFEVPAAQETIPSQQRLVRAFREHDLLVVFLQWVGIENDPYQRMQDKFTWARGLADDIKGCRPGHLRYYEDIEADRDCCAIIDELTPTADEIQLTKRGYGAFFGDRTGSDPAGPEYRWRHYNRRHVRVLCRRHRAPSLSASLSSGGDQRRGGHI